MEFDWDKFKNEENKIAVHCKTEEEAKDFCGKMHEHGMRWKSRDSYLEKTEYKTCEEKTCYTGDGTYTDYNYCEYEGYEILEWSDYIQKEFTKSDLKSGMVVEYRNGTRRMVVDDMLVGVEGYGRLEYHNENLTNKCGLTGLDIMRIYKIRMSNEFEEIVKDENLELIWERKEPKKMTFKEKLKAEEPEKAREVYAGGCKGCPHNYGYEKEEESEKNCKANGGKGCKYCWNREIPETDQENEGRKKESESVAAKSIAFCPDLTCKEEVKGMVIGQGDFTRPILNACIKDKCVAYKDGECRKYNNKVERAIGE